MSRVVWVLALYLLDYYCCVQCCTSESLFSAPKVALRILCLRTRQRSMTTSGLPMTISVETLMLILLSVTTGLLLVAVVVSGYLISRKITHRNNELDRARQALADRVSRYQENQRQLQDIVIKLNGEMKQLKAEVEQQQQQVDETPALRPVQDYERVVSLFAQGKADVSVAQAMGLSRGEAELLSLMADRNTQQ